MERKVATVLFADLVGSTQLGERDPERTRLLLDRFFAAMREEIERVGGTVEKYAGDAVMAAFGAPAALEDHAERALHAALAMQRRLSELDGSLQLRIGVNTGEVVVDGEPSGTFVTGDAVNVCARLEQNGAPGEILVGERTAQIAGGAFEFDELTTIEAKGKAEPVACRRLVRALSLMRPRGVSGLGRVFVGRETELELLKTTYRRAVQEGDPHAAAIVGEAGVGKSRLIRELWEWLAAETPAPARRTGRCLPYGRGITYWPLGEVVKEHLGVLETDAPEEVRRRLGPHALLGTMLGLDAGSDVHPATVRDRLHDAWVDFVGELVGERPLVLLVEDLHWAEPPLLELLDRTLREVRGPLLLLGTARPELDWTLPRRNSTTIWLEPLTPDCTQRMVEGLLAAPLPEAVRDSVVSHAEGNPFFVEELTATLIDQGVLARRDGGWEVDARAASLDVPDTIQGVLAARIDLLGSTEKAALQAGAVIGRVFWEGAVKELIDAGDPDFGLLEERDFIRRRPGSSMAGEREYAIKHALTREVAYAGLPKARRARLHAAFAGWLERLDAREELAPLLAHHYAEAVRPEDADLAWAGEQEELARLRARAILWLRAAGDAALARHELEDAIELFHRALELEPEDVEASAIWREIGRAHAFRYEGEAFWTAMESSLRVCHDRDTCAESYADLAFETASRSGMWRKRPDDELVLGWIDRAYELAAPGSVARTKALLARAFWSRSDDDAAVGAAALADDLGDPLLRAFAAQALTIKEFGRGSYDAAIEAAERALALVPEVANPDAVSGIYETSVPAYAAAGRLDESRRLAVEHQRVGERLSPHHRVHGLAVRIEVDELAGRWESILDLAEPTEAAVEANLSTPCIRNARSLLVVAGAAAAAGDDAIARRYERRGEEVATEGYEAVLAAPRARLRLARGDLDGLEQLVAPFDSYGGQTWFALANGAARLDVLAELGAAEAVEQEAPPHLRERTYLEPFALRALGRVRGDPELLRGALARFEALGLDWHAAQTRGLLST